MVLFKLIVVCLTIAWVSYGIGKGAEVVKARKVIRGLEDEVSYYRATLPYVYPGKGKWQ